MTVLKTDGSESDSGLGGSVELTELLQSLLAIILSAVRTGSFGEYEARDSAEKDSLKLLSFSLLAERLESNTYTALSQFEADFERIIDDVLNGIKAVDEANDDVPLNPCFRHRITAFGKFVRGLFAKEYETLRSDCRTAPPLVYTSDDLGEKKRARRNTVSNAYHATGRTHVVKLPPATSLNRGQKWVLSRKIDYGAGRPDRLRFSQIPDASLLRGKTTFELPDNVDFMQLLPSLSLDASEGSTLEELSAPLKAPARLEPQSNMYAAAHREAMWILYRKPLRPVRYFHYTANSSFAPQYDTTSSDLSALDSGYYLTQMQHAEELVDRQKPLDEWLDDRGLDIECLKGSEPVCTDNEGSMLSTTEKLLKNLEDYQRRRLRKYCKTNKGSNYSIGKPGDVELKTAKSLERRFLLMLKELKPKQVMDGPSSRAKIRQSMSRLFWKYDPLYRGTLLPGTSSSGVTQIQQPPPQPKPSAIADYSKMFPFQNSGIGGPLLPYQQPSSYSGQTNR